jgi:hypothetical protein
MPKGSGNHNRSPGPNITKASRVPGRYRHHYTDLPLSVRLALDVLYPEEAAKAEGGGYCSPHDSDHSEKGKN